jgi:hypothetical protein
MKSGLYCASLLTKKVKIAYQLIGRNIKQLLEKLVARMVEGKCGVDGFVRPGSVRVLTYSSGILDGKFATFDVVYECLTCYPVEGMTFQCVAKNISTAGIRAVINEPVSPVIVYIARDHHYDRHEFSRIKEEDEIRVRVIGSRFELNDKFVSVIAELQELAVVGTTAAIVHKKSPLMEEYMLRNKELSAAQEYSEAHTQEYSEAQTQEYSETQEQEQ